MPLSKNCDIRTTAALCSNLFLSVRESIAEFRFAEDSELSDFLETVWLLFRRECIFEDLG